MKPQMILINVDLPEPFGPVTISLRPPSTSALISENTGRPGYDLASSVRVSLAATGVILNDYYACLQGK
jgi:hypothetical protein